MHRCIVVLILLGLCSCQSTYMNRQAYRDKTQDYHKSQVIPPLQVAAGSSDMNKEAYPLPPANLQGDGQSPDLWPPLFPQPKSKSKSKS